MVRTTRTACRLFLSGDGSLLPPLAAFIGGRVTDLVDAGDVEVLDLRGRAVEVEDGDAGLVRVAALGEGGDVVLQRDRDRVRQHERVGPVEEGVRHHLAVQRRWHAEEVVERVVAVRTPEVVRVAREAQVTERLRRALDLILVSGLTAEIRRVERPRDVGDIFVRGLRKTGFEIRDIVFIGADEGGAEWKTLYAIGTSQNRLL